MKEISTVLLFILFCGVAHAQVSGSLSGVVTDPQGAAVPGAEITATDVGIGRVFRTTSNERGEWLIASVPSAVYRVSASAQGFKTVAVDEVKVEVGIPATVNFKLELGTLAETIEVAAGAEVLQTTTATVSSTLIGRQINELPLVTRNALELVLTQVGTQTPGTPRTSSINGLPKGSMNITLDGINIQDSLLKSDDGFFATIQPKTDAVAEVTVSTAGLTADVAGEGAAQVRYVTRSGTNQLRGGLFWQHRNTFFNANYYFNNTDGLARDRIILNQFGGRAGGPILRNRLFFFVSHEEFRLPQTYNSALQSVLTEPARRGIFTWLDTATNQPRSVDLYALAAQGNTRLPAGTRAFPTTADPLVAQTLSEIADLTSRGGSLRSRVARASDYNRNDFNFQFPGKNNRRFSTVRMDANLTSKHQLEFVYNFQYYKANPDAVNSINPIFPGTGTVLGSPVSGGTRRNSFNAVTAVRSVLTPHLTSEVRFGLRGGNSLFREEIVPALFTRWRGYSLSFNDYVTRPDNARTQSRRNPPLWQGNVGLTWSHGAHNWNFGGSFSQVGIFQQGVGTQAVPTITFAVAANDPVNTGATSIFTTTNFPNSLPGDRSNAAALYATLTGRVSSIGRSVALDEKTKAFGPFPSTDRIRQREFALYLQDNWRVRRDLTFSYGLRWDVQLPFVNLNETYTRVGLEGVYGLSGVGNLFTPGVLTGREPQFFQTASDQGAYKTFWRNYSPSVGLAWTLPGTNGPLKLLFGSKGASVLRAGYSIATLREGMNTFVNIWGSNQGRSVTLTINPGSFPAEFGAPGSVWFRDANLPARPAPDRPSYPIPVVAGNSVNDFDPNLRIGYVQSWNFSLQRELSPNTVLDIRYVGNHGTKLWRQVNLNEVNIFENGFLDEFRIAHQNLEIARRSNPNSTNFGNQGLPGQRNIPIISTALGLVSDTAFATTIAQGQAGSVANSIAFNATRMDRLTRAGYAANLFTVNPTVLGGGAFLIMNGGNSTYNALQAELRRRLSRGILVQGSYAWSKSLSNMLASSSSVFDQPQTLRSLALDKGPSPWDIRHGFKLNWIYELPIGGNHRLLATSQPVLRKVLEGWELAGVARVQSGSPLYLRSSRQTFNSASGQDSSGDAGVVLYNMTVRDLRQMVQIRKDPGGVVYFLPDTLLRNSQAAFEVGGRSLRDLDPNAPYIGPPTIPGQLGYKVYIYGPWQSRWDLSLIKRTAISERKEIEFRVQALNVFNAANFLLGGAGNEVNTGVINSTFGQTRSAYRDTSVSGTNDPGCRLIEFVLRFNF